MRKLLLVLLLVFSGLAIGASLPSQEPKTYAEGNFSYDFHQKNSNWQDKLKSGISIGYDINRYFAVELGVQNIQRNHPEYTDLVGRVEIPLFDKFETFAKFGIAARISEREIGTAWNPIGMVGIKYNLRDNLYVGTQIAHLFKEKSTIRDNNQVMLVIGKNFSV